MRIQFLALISAIAFIAQTSAQQTPDLASAELLRVIRVESDGALILKGAGAERCVALLGVKTAIAAPHQATLVAFLRNLLLGEDVYLVSDEDADREVGADGIDKSASAKEGAPGRGASRKASPTRSRAPASAESAYVYRAPDGLFVNLEVIRQGYAPSASHPMFRLRDEFRQHERQARLYSRGMHGGATTPTPAAKRSAAAQPAPVAAPAVDATGMVYVTKSGKKYHRGDCHYAKTARAVSLAEARQQYEPCSRCKPR